MTLHVYSSYVFAYSCDLNKKCFFFKFLSVEDIQSPHSDPSTHGSFAKESQNPLQSSLLRLSLLHLIILIHLPDIKSGN